ncbi:Hypothetical protein PFREUD_17630 [Propionibacterium freudenreichii subsp. shermanii CIRM-BIA1]|uniref:Uncharacterized protein n=1 Tax=Propionibacterium freudenreichii subsp. shermanii (strain ATCC 9614 / DSM 4902 / CIP 103027 / NCIMB 8099 / CIRM-BIA1) TaxID=754252 RepID=D7GFG1_PROFC|nr:Hypothetical protein PFREUD_17630 [Propionibacterium freudenreichii subsp. shermanii CIRM-BIA1]
MGVQIAELARDGRADRRDEQGDGDHPRGVVTRGRQPFGQRALDGNEDRLHERGHQARGRQDRHDHAGVACAMPRDGAAGAFKFSQF